MIDKWGRAGNMLVDRVLSIIRGGLGLISSIA